MKNTGLIFAALFNIILFPLPALLYWSGLFVSYLSLLIFSLYNNPCCFEAVVAYSGLLGAISALPPEDIFRKKGNTKKIT
ncbi:MAG: hypothetical protein ACXWV6_02695 [Chitinophagaceae bacterium]